MQKPEVNKVPKGVRQGDQLENLQIRRLPDIEKVCLSAKYGRILGLLR